MLKTRSNTFSSSSTFFRREFLGKPKINVKNTNSTNEKTLDEVDKEHEIGHAKMTDLLQ